MTFLATWGCACDFLKMLPKFKMTARGQLQKNCGRKDIIQILLSHPPPYEDVQVTFWRFFWNSKWPLQTNFNFLFGAKTKEISLLNFFKFWHHIPSDMLMCNWFFKDAFKMAARSQLPKFFVGAKTSKLNVRNYSNFTITFPTIWRCVCDFFMVLREFKIAAMHENLK